MLIIISSFEEVWLADMLVHPKRIALLIKDCQSLSKCFVKGNRRLNVLVVMMAQAPNIVIGKARCAESSCGM